MLCTLDILRRETQGTPRQISFSTFTWRESVGGMVDAWEILENTNIKNMMKRLKKSNEVMKGTAEKSK